MPIIEFSDKDILRSKLITPGWYRVRIDATTEAASKDGSSMNYGVEGTVLFNADSGDKEFAGCPTPYWNFNSKAKGFMVGFFQALGADVVTGARFDLKNSEGKEIDVFIENDLYEGRMVNRLNHKYHLPKA